MSPAWSRRSVLLAGVVAVSACGAPAEPKARKRPPERPTKVEGILDSQRVQGPVGFTLGYPPGHAEGDRLPVVVALHGRGGNHHTAFRRLHLDKALAAASKPFVVVSVDGGDHSYWHARDDGTDAGAMVLDELLPLLLERGLDTDRVGLFGWSMGGYGALLLAGRNPKRFRGVAVSSPALFTSASVTSEGSFDDAADYAEHDVYGRPELLAGQHVRLDCGLADPFLQATRDFAARVPGEPVAVFPEGGHDAAYWRRMAVPALEHLAQGLYA